MILRALALLLLSGAAMADPLMKETIPREGEASVLNAEEKAELATLRERHEADKLKQKHEGATVSVFRANADALKAKEITATIDGKPYRFVGSAAARGDGDLWLGYDKPPSASGMPSHTRLEFGRSGAHLGGEIMIDGRPYHIGTIGRFQTLTAYKGQRRP